MPCVRTIANVLHGRCALQCPRMFTQCTASDHGAGDDARNRATTPSLENKPARKAALSFSAAQRRGTRAKPLAARRPWPGTKLSVSCPVCVCTSSDLRATYPRQSSPSALQVVSSTGRIDIPFRDMRVLSRVPRRSTPVSLSSEGQAER